MIFFSKSYRQYSDEQLMGLIRKGDASSFDELYKRYSHRLLHFFYRMLNGDEDKAQDFLQDICLKIVEKADTFNPEGKFSSWIFTIASNMCKNEYRSMRKRISMDNETIDRNYVGPEKAIEEEIDHKNFCDYLYKELYELGYDKRSVFLLRFQEHRTIKEISQILGCAEGTVKSRLFYTTQLLSNRLKVFR